MQTPGMDSARSFDFVIKTFVWLQGIYSERQKQNRQQAI